MKINEDDQTISVRQSWLDTFGRCPEEARLAVKYPEFEAYDTDEALIGTFAHYGIEQVIRGSSPSSIADVIRTHASSHEGVVRYTKRSSFDEVVDMAIGCAEAWVRDILPDAPVDGAHSEVTFSVPLFEHRGWSVLLSGTVDLVPSTAGLWDWKTSARPYKQREKQRLAIQPTIYTMAARSGLLPHATVPDLPAEFHYGVMVKPAQPKKQGRIAGPADPSKCKGEIVTVTRDENHFAWAKHRIKTAVDLALDFGFDKPWPQVDDSFLCNATWCAFWSVCKGAFDPR